MISLTNGHRLDFLASAGVLGMKGRGYLWEQPFRLAGVLRPEEFTWITKTLTFRPRKGNYRWWKPWDTFRLLSAGTVNALGLPNMGYEKWIKDCYPIARRSRCIVSICPFDPDEAKRMAGALSRLRDLVAVEVNVSCPNTEDIKEAAAIVLAVRANCRHPVIAKLGVVGLKALTRALDQQVAAFDLINAVPWRVAFPEQPSPLSHHGGGGVSGRHAKPFAEQALRDCVTVRTPIISGGGIDSVDDIIVRHVMGARGFSFGVALTLKPWLPNRIVAECRERKIGCR